MNLMKQFMRVWMLALVITSLGTAQELSERGNMEKENESSSTLAINFQQESTTLPVEWLQDFGEAYGIRSGANQGVDLIYGWVMEADGQTPVNLVGNGRKRDRNASGDAILQATLMHMQYTGSSGVPTAGIWEMELANGSYDVTVSVGDLSYFDSQHTINVEGTNVIQGFISDAENKFHSETVRVEVLDGKLTIDAIGGTNTKINHLEIQPSPGLEFTTGTLDFVTGKNERIVPAKTSILITSTGENVDINLAKSANSDWLILPENPVLGTLDFAIDAFGLELGTYTTTVTASAEGYLNTTLEVTLRVETLELLLTTNRLNFVVPQGVSAGSFSGNQQAVYLSSTIESVPEFINLSRKMQDNWIILPENPGLGSLIFEVDPGGLAPGNYTTTIVASAPGYKEANLIVNLEVTPLSTSYVWKYKINFQKNTSVTPEGYIADVGKAYGNRGNFEGEELTFGWLDASTGNPASNEANMRERSNANYSKDYLTLGLLEKTAPGATWSMELPNGTYLIEMAAGDTPYTDSDHSLNAEGINILAFQPNSETRFGKKSAEVEITDYRLDVDGTGGSNSKISYIWVGVPNPEKDSVPPVVAVEFEGVETKSGVYKNEVVARVITKDLGGAGIALVEYSVDGGVSWNSYANAFGIKESGRYSLRVRATDAKGNISTTPVYTFEVISRPLNQVKMVLENKDHFPTNDELSFSRIQNQWMGNANHDKVVLRIHNRGINDLRIEDLVISNTNDWAIDHVYYEQEYAPEEILPAIIAPGTGMDVVLHFIATDPPNPARNGVKVLHETLTILSNDDTYPVKEVKLHGLWQRYGESDREPTTNQIMDAFGLVTRTGFEIKKHGRDSTVTGDEVFSFLWQKANPDEPVYVRQLAAYHGCCNSKAYIQYRDQSGNNDPYTQNKGRNFIIGGHIGLDAQSLLPRNNTNAGDGNFGRPAEGTANPQGLFNITMGTGDCTNAYLNYPTKNDPSTLGYIGVRVWKMRNSKGEVVPNTYLMSNDYLSSGANYDYNDNVYILANIRPASGAAHYSELVTGNGLVNDADEKQSVLEFGTGIVGTQSSKTLYIRNLGQEYEDGNDPDIVISSLEIVGSNKTEFLVENPVKPILKPYNAATEQPDQTSLEVHFAPTGAGVKQAVLLIHYTSGNTPRRVPLFGTGTSACDAVQLEKRIKMAAVDANPVTINGETWESDVPYRVDGYGYKLDILDTSLEIAETDNDVLYTSYMSSDANLKPIGYTIPVANGTYMVRLHLVENYWKGENERINHILIEGTHRLLALDVYKEVGYGTALVKDFEVNVADGAIDLEFVSLADRPALAALELFSVGSLTTLDFTTNEIVGATCTETTGVIDVTTTGTNASVVYKLGKFGTYQPSGRFENLTQGTYTIYAKEDTLNGCQVSKVYEVPVNQSTIDFVLSPEEVGCTINATASATVTQITGGTGPYEVVWNHNPFTTGSVVHGLTDGKDYLVTVTDFIGCSTTRTFQLTKSIACTTLASEEKQTSVKREDKSSETKEQIRFYPNPFTTYEVVHIQTPENMQKTEKATVHVIDTKGNTLLTQTGALGELENTLNTQMKDWGNGLYILQVYVNDQSHVFKIVKAD